MATTTSYGTWVNHGDSHRTNVEATVLDAISGGDSDWVQQVIDSGALETIAGDYRDAINRALPEGVALSGDEFYGPAFDVDRHFAGYPLTEDGQLDIHAIVEGVDLFAIVERHDPDA